MPGKRLIKFKEAVHRNDIVSIKCQADKLKQCNVKEAVQFCVSHGTYEDVEALPFSWLHVGEILHLAVKRGHEPICKYLLGKGLDINAIDAEGNTPLYYACLQRNKILVKFLVEHGANPRIANMQNQTPIDILQRQKQEDILKVIERCNIGAIASRQSKAEADIHELQEEVQSLSETITSVDRRLQKLDTLASKEDLHHLFEGSGYVDMLKQQQQLPYLRKPMSRSVSRKDDLHVYSYLDCDFLQSNGNLKRRMGPEEIQHVKSKLTYLTNNLKCNEMMKDIADRMYEKDALSDEQMQHINHHKAAKENVRYILVDVIITGGKLHRFLALVKALRDIGEHKVAEMLMKRENQEDQGSTKL